MWFVSKKAQCSDNMNWSYFSSCLLALVGVMHYKNKSLSLVTSIFLLSRDTIAHSAVLHKVDKGTLPSGRQSCTQVHSQVQPGALVQCKACVSVLGDPAAEASTFRETSSYTFIHQASREHLRTVGN